MTTAIVCATILWLEGFRRGSTADEAPVPQTPGSGAIGRGRPTARARRVGPDAAADGVEDAERRLCVWLHNMVPIGAAQGLGFFGTNAYMYLTITFTQMLAAFTPTVTLVLLYLTGARAEEEEGARGGGADGGGERGRATVERGRATVEEPHAAARTARPTRAPPYARAA